MTVLNAKEFTKYLTETKYPQDFGVTFHQSGLNRVMIIFQGVKINYTIDPFEYRKFGWELSNVHVFPSSDEVRVVYAKVQLD